MDLGMHTTLTDENSKLDPEVLAISARLTPLQASEFGKVWDLFQTRETPFITDEFEILVRNYTTPEITTGTSGAGLLWNSTSVTEALPVGSGFISRVTVGDVLLLPNGGEIVVVKSVNRGANTIEVYERGVGETTATAQPTTAFVAKIVGNAHREGKVDGEAMAEGTTKFTNYMQIVQENIDLSHADSEQARKTGRTAPVLRQEALERVIRDLARSSIYSTARVNTASLPATTRGLLGWLGLAQGLKANVGGEFTETTLRDGFNVLRTSGGSPNAIVMSVANKNRFNTFSGADVVKQDVNDRTTGRIIERYNADGIGSVPVIVDLDFPDDKVAIVDSRKMVKGWKAGDALRFTPHTDTHPRQIKELLHGKFGLAVENVGQSHYLLENLS